MSYFSPRVRKLQERDSAILQQARDILLLDGYYGLTMERIAVQSGVSKGTVYHCFSCKEEIIIALAEMAWRKRTELMRKGTQFRGHTRERILAVGEAVLLFVKLYPDDSRIIHIAMGPLREKTPPLRLQSLVQAEQEQQAVLKEIVDEAIRQGDLTLKPGVSVDEIIFGTWGLVDGAHALIEGGVPVTSVRLSDPFDSVWRFWNMAADGYGWRPFFSDWDYLESVARARREVFAEEVQLAYGGGS